MRCGKLTHRKTVSAKRRARTILPIADGIVPHLAVAWFDAWLRVRRVPTRSDSAALRCATHGRLTALALRWGDRAGVTGRAAGDL